MVIERGSHRADGFDFLFAVKIHPAGHITQAPFQFPLPTAAKKANFSRIRVHKSQQGFQGGGFARAVAANEAGDPSWCQVEGDIF